MSFLYYILPLFFLPIFMNLSIRRSDKQPLIYSSQSEALILAHLYLNPNYKNIIKEITPDHFAFPEHRNIYSNLITKEKKDTLDKFPIIEKYLVIYREWLDNENLKIKSSNFFRKFKTNINFKKFIKEFTKSSFDDFLIYKVAEFCYFNGEDRLTWNGLSIIVENNDPDRPLLRKTRTLPKSLTFLFTIFYLLSIHASYIIADNFSDNLLHFNLLFSAFFILSSGSLVLSLVDLNTMYIDLLVFFTSFFLVYFILSITAFFNTDFHFYFIESLLYTFFAAVFFKLIILFYFIVRGKLGMGDGDLMLIFLTSAPLVAVTGDYMSLFYSILIGFIFSIFVFIIRYPFKKYRITSTTPFPLGPYLALGWSIYILLLEYTNIFENLDKLFLL
jgi:hypothetical protein